MVLVGPLMPDRLQVITQTKRDTLVLQVGGWAWAVKFQTVEKLVKIAAGRLEDKVHDGP